VKKRQTGGEEKVEKGEGETVRSRLRNKSRKQKTKMNLNLWVSVLIKKKNEQGKKTDRLSTPYKKGGAPEQRGEGRAFVNSGAEWTKIPFQKAQRTYEGGM